MKELDLERRKIRPRERGDDFGLNHIVGVRERLTARKQRKLRSGRAHFYHRATNGVHDPMTWYHLVYAIANIEPNIAFTAGALTDYMNSNTPRFQWDSTSIGRILNDIAESFNDIGEADNPIVIKRDWQGTFYSISEQPPARQLLISLLEDIWDDARAFQRAEERGERPLKTSSPAGRLPIFVAPFQAE